ncbi:CADD family putative folate metabolism protein [Candidatus Woesearchaeota archaeon]|nr:CADD family putative folate metabolism protein [Candidatus Woesearchaeota archaeon]
MDLKQIVERKSLLQHPFYRLWLAGRLPKEALQKYTQQYFQLVDHLPRFISTLHSHCNNEYTRKILLINLMEEELGENNGGTSHSQLWLDFAQEMGVGDHEIHSTILLPETKQVIELIYAYCHHSLSEGAAALYAYESQVPQIAQEKLVALQQHYELSSPKALRFFEVHKTADIKHGNVWKHFAQQTTNPMPEENAARAVSEGLWKMFDAMYAEFVPMDIKTVC